MLKYAHANKFLKKKVLKILIQCRRVKRNPPVDYYTGESYKNVMTYNI